MKKSIIVIIIILACVIKSNAQNYKNKLSFEFGYGINGYSMGKLNEFYIDSFAAKPNICLLKDKITSGQNFNFALRYQPTGLFDIGIYGNYQYGSSKHNPTFTERDDFGLPIKDHTGTYELKTQAIGVGLTSTWYVSHILKFNEKENKFLKRFHFGVELNGGIGFSKVTTDIRVSTLPIVSFYEYFTSTDFQGQAGLKFEYDFVKSPIISAIGIKGGYQYFRTQTVKDRLDRNWEVLGQHPINLDFSGFYIGTYLKIGK